MYQYYVHRALNPPKTFIVHSTGKECLTMCKSLSTGRHNYELTVEAEENLAPHTNTRCAHRGVDDYRVEHCIQNVKYAWN